MARQKRKQTAAEKRTRRERKKKFMTIFINGKQERIPRPPMIDGMPVDESIARNADPIWLHQNEMWELLTPCDETCVSTDSQTPPKTNGEYSFLNGQDS
jgi:hypothetical protein